MGVPRDLICDPSGEQTSGEVKQFANNVAMNLKILEENTQHANLAELYIGIMKNAISRDLRETGCPLTFWCYATEWRMRVHNVTASKLAQCHRSNPHTATTGETKDISDISKFGFFQWVMYYNKNTSYPQGRWCLGRALGPTKNVGNKMCQWILKTNGEIVARRTVHHLNAGEEVNPAFEAEKSEMMTYIYQRYGSPFRHKNVQPRRQQHDDFVPYEPVYDDEGFISSEMPGDAEFNGESNLPVDAFVNMEVLMSQGGEERVARVVGRAVDENGELIGQHNDNPILNTLLYEVEFPDGQCQTYAANLIAEAV